ncbi:MAG: recombination protein RecR [Bacteroidetes bacterium]|nr:recombination protein RecR [Bacteroidota bacterium]
MYTFPSKYLENAVNELSKLPGIGKKTALRLVLHLLKQAPEQTNSLGESLIKLRNEISFCNVCHNISDTETCLICSNPKRDKSLVCVVEDVRDVMAIENTNQYKGVYHILGGIISPMDGIGPGDLTIDSLVNKVAIGEVKEVIMALSATMEGDTTNFYIYKRLKEYDITITTIARGIAIGDDLEYTDEITLGRSILNRLPYENSLVK